MAAVILLSACSVLSACSDSSPKPQPKDPSEAVSQVVEAWRVAEGVTAAVVGIDTPSLGRTIVARGTVARGSTVPVDSTSIFRIGSVTKTFTAALILQLAEAGRLNLDDTLGQRLPGVYVPNADRITIRQLLANRSGLPEYQEAPGFNDAIIADFSRVWTSSEALARFGSAEPTSAPGERYAYSSTNFLLLGMIAEAASGESFSAAVSSQLLKPLHLDHTSLDEKSPAEVVHGYSRKYAPLVGKDLFDVATISHVAIATSSIGAGNATSNGPDLLTWGRALYAGGALSSASRTAMLTFDPAFAQYGLGAFAFDTGHGRAVGHGGEDPGFTSTLMYFPDLDLVITALVDADDVDLQPLVEHVLDAVIGPGKSQTASLVESLGSPDKETRRAAALALGQVTSETSAAIGALAEALTHDDSADVRAAAALALGIVGKTEPDRTAPILRVAVSDSDSQVRDAAMRALEALTGTRP